MFTNSNAEMFQLFVKFLCNTVSERVTVSAVVRVRFRISKISIKYRRLSGNYLIL